jgi:hypothetical protein
VLEPSWVFYSGRPIRELRWRKDESVDRPPGWLVAEHLARGPDAFVITTATHLENLAGALPEDIQVLAETDLFLQGERLVLLGRERTRLVSEPTGNGNQPNGQWK